MVGLLRLKYWRIVGVVESFLEGHTALERHLRAVASYSIQADTGPVAELLNSQPHDRRKNPWRLSHAERWLRLR
ncbi:hypothetical protein HYPDE_39258 [Hyphomicrobium denitrificans 1NES1]|uniref:Uncharacterized protein n=1 Tax=Hyphomicrobium denitrificans 1NES1 TaxID=670307 RepID=N0BGI8_9HYPH|nr:hypothetical protein HYPDE_39258 [Hyphomicrobium denitrificans 1NES1]